MSKKHLRHDASHIRETSRRWMSTYQWNRSRESEGAEEHWDQWVSEQCEGCRYFMTLRSSLGRDWGVCSNSDSNFDGKIRFEHDGCAQFSVMDDEL